MKGFERDLQATSDDRSVEAPPVLIHGVYGGAATMCSPAKVHIPRMLSRTVGLCCGTYDLGILIFSPIGFVESCHGGGTATHHDIFTAGNASTTGRGVCPNCG